MDVDRLKNDGSILTNEFFERQLEKIRDIRISERKYYQKVTDIYATSSDYDKDAKTRSEYEKSISNFFCCFMFNGMQ